MSQVEFPVFIFFEILYFDFLEIPCFNFSRVFNFLKFLISFQIIQSFSNFTSFF